jgi:2-polyprenyl-6-methoxyphenol hydroxylase-like FAD-dependent oxidoreductase
VTVRRGVRVSGLLAGSSAVPGVPHAAGVRTATGQEIRADLVVDATGRRTPAQDWLAGLGARGAHVEAELSGFVYYTRYFSGAALPSRRAPAMTPIGSISLLTLEGDNNTWSVSVCGPTGDAPLKALRDPGIHARVVAACPRHAHWLDGRPITGVLPMAGLWDCYRRFVVDGEPVVTGFVAVGDAWACTNPSGGRGLSLGLFQAQLLRATVAAHLDDPAVLAGVYDHRTVAEVTPYYRHQLVADRARVAEMNAIRQALPPPPGDPVMGRFLAAAMHDADVFRALLETVTCLALPAQVLARPGMPEKVDRYGDAPRPPSPGPDRTRLLQLLGAA